MARKDTYYEIDANSKREFNMYSGLSTTAILIEDRSMKVVAVKRLHIP